MDNNELQHHGIKGQRWGVRRSPKQLGHDIVEKITKKGKFTEADGKIKGTGQKAKAKTVKEQKQEILKSRSAKKLYDNADLFTTKELQDAYNRLSLERNIKNLAPSEIKRGEQIVNSVIKWSNKANDVVTAGTKLYNTTAKVANALGKGKDLPLIGEKGDKKKTYDYEALRNKALKDLSDDELVALNTRNGREATYNNRKESSVKTTTNKTESTNTATYTAVKRVIASKRRSNAGRSFSGYKSKYR